MDDLINLRDYERAAAQRLPAGALGYYASGADDERTLRDNEAAFARLRLLPRVLVDVSERDLATTVLGTPVSLPVLIAPMAMQAMAHPDGELATVRAAARTGTVMILSTISNTAVEDVVAAAGGPVWFQLYVHRDRDSARRLVARVREAGCEALVVTVDLPVIGRREADVRNRFSLPDHLTLPNVEDRGRGLSEAPEEAASALAAHAASQIDPGLTWDDLDWLVREADMPVVVKGVLHPEDAVQAFDRGARAVVVSNHGGRQLDTVPAGIDALPAVVDAAGHLGEILVDGGIRRGTDVVKALALGARAVLLGRPLLWGLAVDGEDGAARVLSLLREELDVALALCGCRSPGEIGPELIWPVGSAP